MNNSNNVNNSIFDKTTEQEQEKGINALESFQRKDREDLYQKDPQTFSKMITQGDMNINQTNIQEFLKLVFKTDGNIDLNFPYLDNFSILQTDQEKFPAHKKLQEDINKQILEYILYFNNHEIERNGQDIETMQQTGKPLKEGSDRFESSKNLPAKTKLEGMINKATSLIKKTLSPLGFSQITKEAQAMIKQKEMGITKIFEQNESIKEILEFDNDKINLEDFEQSKYYGRSASVAHEKLFDIDKINKIINNLKIQALITIDNMISQDTSDQIIQYEIKDKKLLAQPNKTSKIKLLQRGISKESITDNNRYRTFDMSIIGNDDNYTKHSDIPGANHKLLSWGEIQNTYQKYSQQILNELRINKIKELLQANSNDKE